MDYDKTVEAYTKQGLVKQWDQQPDRHRHKKEMDFFKAVKSPRTNDFYQASDLVNKELVPPGWEAPHKDSKGKAVKYPMDVVQGILRKRLGDGSNVLLTTRWVTAIDSLGNPQSIAMNDKEWYDDVLPIYTYKPENPRDRDPKMIKVFDHIEHRPVYTMPFTPENVDNLYKQRNGACSLSIKDDMKAGANPVSVDSLDVFKLPSMDEIHEIHRRAAAGDRVPK